MTRLGKVCEFFPFLVFGFFLLTLTGHDYTFIRDPFRDGPIRYCIVGGALVWYLHLFKIHKAWATFCFYNLMLWVWFNFSEMGVVDVLVPTFCLVLGNYIAQNFDSEKMEKTIVWVAMANGLYGLAQVLGFDPIFEVTPEFKFRAIGLLGHNTMLGPFVSIASLYFLSKKNWKLLAVSLVFLYQTDSSMSYGAFIAGALYILFRERPAFAISIGAVGVASLIGLKVFLPDLVLLSSTGRWQIYPKAIDAWLFSPVIGHGPGSWFAKLPQWGATKDQIGMNWHQVHSDWLQLLPEGGLVLFLITLVGVGLAFKKAQHLKPIYGAWLMLLCANSLGNFPMHLAQFGIFAGWLACTIEKE